MAALSDQYQVVAIDQRGYNLSDKPKGVENYQMKLLVGDVAAVIKSLGRDKAIIVGHDWGGMVAWQFAMTLPQMTDKLIILNLPHPRGLIARAGAQSGAAEEQPVRAKLPAARRGVQVTAEGSGRGLRIRSSHAKYLEAFQRSDIEAMLNYYKRNYPREPYTEDTSPVVKLQMPVLEFHGLKDTRCSRARSTTRGIGWRKT